MASPDRKPGQIAQIVLLATAIVGAAATGAAGLVRQVEVLGPRVGDIVTFDPRRPFPFDSAVRLDVARPPKTDCVLDLGVMQRSGGSLVVEQRTTVPRRLYRAHWAGARTSMDADDCGTDGDVVLSATDINVLATASNGFGMDRASGSRTR
jgi:hypothetical protein